MTCGNRLEDAFQNGNATHHLRDKRKGNTAYTDKIEANPPGVIRKLYRYAKQAIGIQSLFIFIAQTMNRKAEQIPELMVSRQSLTRTMCGDGLKSRVEKRNLQKRNRI